MRFLADMGVDVRVVQWPRRHGHDATHLHDEGLHRMSNGEIFAKAIAEDRVILTFDLDFGEIVAFSKGRKASVILFRLHSTRTSHVIEHLAAVLADSMDALEKGAVIIVEESHHRIRPLPIGGKACRPLPEGAICWTSLTCSVESCSAQKSRSSSSDLNLGTCLTLLLETFIDPPFLSTHIPSGDDTDQITSVKRLKGIQSHANA